MKSWLLVFGCALAATTAVAQAPAATEGTASVGAISKGQMLVSANGARLGAVYRVNADGSPQIIIDGKMVTIPATTLSSSNGRLMTSLTKSAVSELH